MLQLARDEMQAIDLRAITRLIMAILVLLKYFECVEKILDMEGLAALQSRLEARMNCCLALREGPDGQL